MGLELAVDVVADVELSPAVDRAWFKQQVRVLACDVWRGPRRVGRLGEDLRKRNVRPCVGIHGAI